MTLHFTFKHDKWGDMLGKTHTYCRTTLVDGHLIFSMRNSQFSQKYQITKTSSSYAGCTLGPLISSVDILGEALGIISGNKPVKTFDLIASLSGIFGTFFSNPQIIPLPKEINNLINQGILRPNSVNVDESGVWFKFEYPNQFKQQVQALIQLYNSIKNLKYTPPPPKPKKGKEKPMPPSELDLKREPRVK